MTIKQRQHLLAYLGYYVGVVDGDWGSGSRAACTAFQQDRNIKADGHGGPETDKALIQAVANGLLKPEPVEDGESVSDTAIEEDWWDEIEYFDFEEVKCKCGGKYCDGRPHEMQKLTMQIADRARRWSGNPITVISGLRCETHNKNEKGVWNSQHMFGEALDVYFYGKSPNAALAWLQSQPDVRYAYRIEGSNNIHFDIQPVGR